MLDTSFVWMNLSYGETESDYRLFPCLRLTDLRKKPGGTLRPRWTGFTSMRVQGLMVSVSKWQVNCPNTSHSAFIIPTAIEISWVVGIFARSYDLGNSALTLKALSVSNFKTKGFFSYFFAVLNSFHSAMMKFFEDMKTFLSCDKYPMDPSELTNDSK